MKEVMSIIRMNMINKTKKALLDSGFPSITVRKVLGRGKKKIDFSVIQNFISDGAIESAHTAEQLSEGHRLVPKRLITMIVNDEDVKKAVDTIISVNSTGNPGDGKIFVLPINDVLRIRTGEIGTDAV